MHSSPNGTGPRVSSTTRLPGEVVSGVHLNYVLGTEFVFSVPWTRTWIFSKAPCPKAKVGGSPMSRAGRRRLADV